MRIRRAPQAPPPEQTTVVDDALPPGTVVEEEELLPPAPPEPPPRPLLWPWLLLLLALVISGLVAAWLLTRDNGHKSTVNVPNVVRLTAPEAVSRVHSRGLISRILRQKSSAAPGTVVAQHPNPGADVLRNSVVTLTVSAAQNAAVPDVLGQRSATAVTALRAEGFDVKRTTVTSNQATGTVVAQSPQAGSQAARGSTVTINVSRGLVAVPRTVGLQRDAAVTAVRGAGLVPMAFTVRSSRPKGVVVAQRPAARKRVAGGSTVRLNVSSGSTSATPPPPPPPVPPPPPPPSKPPTVTVPDVTGQLQDAAQKQLNASGLKAGIVYVASDEVQGTVVSQAPEGGTTQKRGMRIQLNVSLGPRAVVKGVPDVLNLTPADARSKLTAAGFRVQTLPQGVSDPSQIGKIVDEQPAGAKNAPTGSVVTIYVGRAA